MTPSREQCLFCQSRDIIYTYIPFCSDKCREQFHEERQKSLHRMTAAGRE